MILSSQILLILSICLSIFCLITMSFLKKESFEKNHAHQVCSFVIDGIKAYSFRSFSSIIQIIIYTSIVLLLFSKSAGKSMDWSQLTAVFLGGLSMSVFLFLIAGYIPYFIPKVIEKSKGYFNDGLRIQFKMCTVLGFLSVSSILVIALVIYQFSDYTHLIGYCLGIVFASFFMRIGGGLFKASIDIGKNTSENLEKDLPTDERNPSVLLDISGDYIGKICGFCSDILGSFFLCFLAVIMFNYAFEKHLLFNAQTIVLLKEFPFQIVSIGIIGSFLGYLFSKLRISSKHNTNILLESLYIAIVICGLGTYFITHPFPTDVITSIWTGFHTFKPFYAYLAGLIGAAIICFSSEILTSNHYPFSKAIAKHAEFTSSITHLQGIGLGLQSNLMYLIYLIATCSFAYYFAGLYGIALASLGILSVSSTIITIHTFSALATSVKNIAFYSTTNQTARCHTQKLNILGQSTIAIGNGFSTLTAFLSSFSLFLAFICLHEYDFSNLFSTNILWVTGLFSGIVLPLVTSGFLIKTSTKTILFIIKETKRQFRDIPYLKEGKAKPDMIKLSDDTARTCMDGLIIPGILVALIPIVLGYLVSIPIIVSFCIGSLLIGPALSYYWAITGDVLSNAKHFIQQGHCGGTDSPNYKAIKQSDTIANIYKDVLSPSLSIIMKSTVILTVTLLCLI